MLKKLITTRLLLVLLFGFSEALAQNGATVNERVIRTIEEYEQIHKLPNELRENSGIIRNQKGNFWVHNDSGNLPYVYEVDSLGNIIRSIKITGASNYDWEDITVGTDGSIYIGDTGNNKNNRRSLLVYKIPPLDTLTGNKVSASIIKFSYQDQPGFPPPKSAMNFDVEAMAFFQDSLYLFTKNQSDPFDGIVRIYSLPTTPGEYSISAYDSINLNLGPMMENWITGADISPEGSKLALLSHSKLFIVENFEKSHFSSGQIIEYNLPDFSQKEAVCFINESELCITDELFQQFLGGNLYRVVLDE